MIGQRQIARSTPGAALVPAGQRVGSSSRRYRSLAAPANAALKRHEVQRPLKQGARSYPRPAKRQGAGSVVCKAAPKNNEVLVVGATGQSAARIALQLARSGYKVTAGVEDLAAAQEAIEFAKRTELLLPAELAQVKATELNPADSEALAAALPKKGGRVVVVAGDVVGTRRADPKPVQRAIDALAANPGSVSQLVLVTPVGGPQGTGIFGLGGKPKPNMLSKLEQQVVESGLNYLLVRTAITDRVPDSYGADAQPVVTSFGALPAGLSVSRFQVAEAVVEAMTQQPAGDAIIEVGAAPDAEAVPIADQVMQVLREAAAAAAADRQQRFAEEAAQQEQEEPAAGGVLGTIFKTVSKKPAVAVEVEVEEEEEVVEEKPAKKGGLFSFGTTKKQVKQPEPEPEPVEEKKPAARGGFFGTTRKQVKQPEPEPEPVEEKKPAARGGFFGTTRKQVKQQVEEEEEPAAEEKAPAPRGGLFGTTRKQVKQPEPEPVEEKKAAAPRGGLFAGSKTQQQRAVQQEEEPAPAPRTVKRGRNPLPPPEEPKPARAAAAKRQEEEPAQQPKKKGGFLQALGIGQETAYVDEI